MGQTRKFNRYAYGGALPEDPELARQRARVLQQQQAGESAAAMAPKALGLLGSLGIGGGGAAAAAGAAGAGAAAGGAGIMAAAGPVGAALGAGMLLSGVAGKAARDENGFYKDDSFKTRALASVESTLNPLKTISNLGKVISGKRSFTDLYGIKDDMKKREEIEGRQQRTAISQANNASTQVYGSLLGSYSRGGLLPADKFADGGNLPPTKKPAVTGTYSTRRDVQSQDITDRNATAMFLEQFKNDPRGLQQAYGAAINDIPHPVTGKPISYAALKQEFGTNGQALFASPAYRQGGYKTANDYLQSVFTDGQKRLNQRGVQQPLENAFAPAVETVDALRRQQGIEGPQVGAYDDARSATAAYQNYGYQARGKGTVSVAPGMALQTGARVARPVQQTVVQPVTGVASRRNGGLLPGKRLRPVA